MRSTQYYGQTRRFVVVDTTPKSVRVREIHRGRLGDILDEKIDKLKALRSSFEDRSSDRLRTYIESNNV